MNLSSGTLQVTEWQFLVSHREMTFVFLLFEEPEEMSSQIVMTSLVSESQCVETWLVQKRCPWPGDFFRSSHWTSVNKSFIFKL